MRIKKESVITYLFITLLIGVAIGSLYFFNVKFTGLAVYEQGNQSEFDLGTYNNTEYNGSAVVLSSGQISGTYTSKIFDVGDNAAWNNISWTSNDMGELLDNAQGNLMSENVLLMHMNNNSSVGENNTYFYDFSGNGNDGSCSSTACPIYDLSDKKLGAASMEFDGTDDTILVQDDPSIETNDITLSVWYKADITPNGGEMFKRWGGAGNRVFQHYFTSNKHTFRLSDDGVNIDCSPQYSSTVAAGVWSHLIFSFDDTNDEVVIMINGVDETFGCVMSGLYQGSSQNINVGGSGIEFNGKMDEFAIWNRVLSSDEILDIYKKGILRLNLTARTCNDNNCSGETWTDITDTSPQDLSLDNNQYFQYRFDFETDNTSYTPALQNVTIDYTSLNLAPTISIVEPRNILYLSNESLSLNYSVSDSDGNLDSCWYNLDGGENITLVDCLNTTFNTSEASHILYIYANDTEGLKASDSVSFNVDLTGVSISILEPTGTKSSRTGITIVYTTIGNNLTCWYNVKTSIGGDTIENTTLEDCSNSSFDVSTDGDFVLNLYANNSFATLNSASSSFSVSISSGIPPSGGGGGGSSRTTVITGNLTTELNVSVIKNLIADPGDTKKISWTIKNTGTNFLNGCKFRSTGGLFSWIDYTEIKNLAAGEEYEFIFDLHVPEEIGSGEYGLGVTLECQGISKSVNFIVEIIEKKLDFDLLKVERIAKDQLKMIYSLEELAGLEQYIELEFLLFDSNNEKAVEVKENKTISANSKKEFEILIPIEPSLEGKLNLLVNLNSATYSTFVQESIILGAAITGLAVFRESGKLDNFASIIFITFFLVLVFFVIRRIRASRKKKK